MDPPPPISRDGFEYHSDGFFVLVHPNHRHRRFTIPELRAFFTSTSKKASLKDQPAHWYRAQLIHYGLQPTDRKDTATLRLLDALKRKTLEVPASIQKLERDLKKEYNEKKKKKKKKAKAEKPRSLKLKAERKRRTPTAKKRLADITDLDLDCDCDNGDDDADLAGPALVPQTQPPVPTPRRPGRLGLSISNLNFNFNVAGFVGSPRKRAPSHVRVTPVEQLRQQTQEEAESDGLLKDEDEPESSRSRNHPFPIPQTLTLGLLKGSYTLNSLTTNTHNADLILTPDRFSIWGAFHLGCVEGVLSLADRPWTICRDDGPGCPFLWRARDLDTGLGIAGAQHAGEMRFLGGGRIDGVFWGFPDGEGGWCECAFWGVRNSPWVSARDARDAVSMRREWESFW